VFCGFTICCRCLLVFWPIQVPLQKLERPRTVDGVRAVEKLDRRAVPDAERVVQPADLRVFVSDPFVRRDAILVAAFDHERTRRWGSTNGSWDSQSRMRSCCARITAKSDFFSGFALR